MKIETFTVQGTAEWNEDALVVNESLRLYGVLDGATSVHPYRGPNGETGGYLASHIIRQYFESLRTAEAETDTLKPLVMEANAMLRKRMLEAGIDVHDKQSLWTSALALVRINDYSVDYAQAGDCMIAAVYEDGTIRSVTRDQVAPVDRLFKRKLEETIRAGITDKAELRKRVTPVILHNRSKMNTLGGYSVMSGEPELADMIEYGRMNRIGLKSLLIITDGLFLPEDNPGQEADTIVKTTARIAEMSLSGYAEWLIGLEREDSECIRYPRFKVSDDKTGIWIRW